MRQVFRPLPAITQRPAWRDKRTLLLVLAVVTIAVVACRGGGSNPSASDQVLPVILPTASSSSCINAIQPEDAPQFEEIDFSRLTAISSRLSAYDIVEGTGETPALADAVTAEYTAWLENGCMFDSSYPRSQPSTFPLINLIPGWQETFLTMKVGGERVVEISPEGGYGALGRLPEIPPNATLYFHVRLVDHITLAEAQATASAAIAAATATAVAAAETVAAGGVLPTPTLSPGCQNSTQPEGAPTFADIDSSRFEPLADGLRFYEVTAGTGESPVLTDTVSVEYTGWLENGCMFDSSYRDAGPVSFPLGAVIEGWQQGLAAMQVGGTWVLEISPELGYGSGGSGTLIPGGATLIFYVNLIGTG